MLPIKNGDIPASYVIVYQRVIHIRLLGPRRGEQEKKHMCGVEIYPYILSYQTGYMGLYLNVYIYI